MRKVCLLAASLLVSGPAMAGLIISSGQTPMFIPNSNDFKADLNGLGLDSVYEGGADVTATQSGTVLFYYHGAESNNVNEFVVGATFNGSELTPGTVLATEADEPFGPGVFIGSINIAAGQSFSDLGIGFNVGVQTNPLSTKQDAPAGTQGFGVFFNAAAGGTGNAYSPMYFGFDDDGNRMDDNHDDMVVSAVFVPEPGSIALLALGSLAMVRRRR